VADGDEGRPSDELLDKYFETFKHLSTLNIAAGVLVVALLTERYGGAGNITLVVLLFAASVVVALGGMEAVLEELRREPRRPVLQRTLRRWHYASVVFLALGLALSLVYAL
jgi:hypothetical protein